MFWTVASFSELLFSELVKVKQERVHAWMFARLAAHGRRSTHVLGYLIESWGRRSRASTSRSAADRCTNGAGAAPARAVSSPSAMHASLRW
jgi:hypothetical protein